jgi:hypothetical protein
MRQRVRCASFKLITSCLPPCQPPRQQADQPLQLQHTPPAAGHGSASGPPTKRETARAVLQSHPSVAFRRIPATPLAQPLQPPLQTPELARRGRFLRSAAQSTARFATRSATATTTLLWTFATCSSGRSPTPLGGPSGRSTSRAIWTRPTSCRPLCCEHRAPRRPRCRCAPPTPARRLRACSQEGPCRLHSRCVTLHRHPRCLMAAASSGSLCAALARTPQCSTRRVTRPHGPYNNL